MGSFFIQCIHWSLTVLILMHRVSLVWPGGTPSGWFLVLLTDYHHSLSASILSDATRCSRLILYFSCPSFGISRFPRSPDSFSRTGYLEAKIWVSGTRPILKVEIEEFTDGLDVGYRRKRRIPILFSFFRHCFSKVFPDTLPKSESSSYFSKYSIIWIIYTQACLLMQHNN